MRKISKKNIKTKYKLSIGQKGAEHPAVAPDVATPQTRTHKSRNIRYYLAAAVSLLTFAVYLAALRNDFVHWDDNLNVYENSFIRLFDMTFVKQAFLHLSAVDYWRPLTWISHALDYAIWGLNPMGHHLTNNILHAANTFLVVLLVARLIDSSNQDAISDKHLSSSQVAGVSDNNSTTQALNSSLPRSQGWRLTIYDSRFTLIAAGVTGLLFGLHPLQVESVAWVSERKNLLYALFYLLSLMTYMRYAAFRPGNNFISKPLGSYCKPYFLSLFFFLLSLMSKPMAVSLPLVLLILDWYPYKRLQHSKACVSSFIEKLPFIALSLIAAIMTALAQNTVGATEAIGNISLQTRLLVAARSLVLYLVKIIFPSNLVPYYPYPKNVSLLSPEYLLPVLFVAVITIGCLVASRRNRVLLSCWVYYVATLLPVIGIIQVGRQSMADRYLYLPGLVFFLLVGLAAGGAAGSGEASNRHALRIKLVSAATAIVVAVLSYMTIGQVGIWRNSITLWTYVIEKEPSCDFAYVNRGSAFNDSGEFDKAIENFDKAMTINPSYFMAYYNRGLTLLNMGLLDKAMKDLNEAISLDPAAASAYYARGMVHEKRGEQEAAIWNFEQAVAANPSYGAAYLSLGVLYGKAGKIDQAIRYLDKAIDLRPNNFLAYNNRGFAYSLLGRYDRALSDFNKAIELNSGYAGVYGDRANVYLKMGRSDLAARDFRKACGLGNRGACISLQNL